MPLFRISILSFFILALVPSIAFQSSLAQAGADRLVMFDSHSCPSCRQFKRQMARKYRRSDLGRALPLKIINVHSRKAMRRYRSKTAPIGFTPTFVLMHKGREAARFVGYDSPSSFMKNVRALRRHWVKY